MTNKRKTGWYIDEEDISRIDTVARIRGVNPSEIVGVFVRRGLASTSELTSIERFHYKKLMINDKLNGLLDLVRIKSDAERSQKYLILGGVCHAFRNQKPLRNLAKLLEQGIFETLNELKDVDIAEFEKIKAELGQFGKMRQRYLSTTV